jgi:hypothetical protein
MILSPLSVNSSIAKAKPFTTPGIYVISSFSTLHPCLLSSQFIIELKYDSD